MTVAFELDGQSFTGLNGGGEVPFSWAVSFQVDCATQEEVDYYAERLGEGGDPAAQICGWVQDKFGLSWQIVPRRLIELTTGEDRAQANRVFQAMLKMKKIIIADLEEAARG